MKIAAIDLGSNSIHMVIVEVGLSGTFRVVDRETEMVRLGAGTLSTGVLPEDAMQRALSILKAYRRLTEIHGVEEILAVATSAIREARNGEDFLERIGRKVGIWPRAITGEEEARLVYLAALHSVHVGKRSLVIDIGGGSLELALGRGPSVKLAVSEKLGVLRMTERFMRSDPISPDDEKKLVRHVRKTLAPAVSKIRRLGFDGAVGTSGTILALGRLAAEIQNGQRPDSLHHMTISTDALGAAKRRLARLDVRGRLRLHGLDRRRADIVVAGAIVLTTVLEMVDARKLVLCEWALREGILLDYINRHPVTLAEAEAYPDVRRRSVLQLSERNLCDAPHARKVADLALALFDGTRKFHGLPDADRDVLEYAALLHNAGHHISDAGHHKHTYYLIKNGGLRGFDPKEIELIALVARSHRRGSPKRSHPPFAALRRSQRRAVEVLSAILGVADGLDRSHQQRIRDLSVARHRGTLVVRCRASLLPELELWGARKRLDLLGKALRVPVHLEIAARVRSAAKNPPHDTRASTGKRSSTRVAAKRGRRSRPLRAGSRAAAKQRSKLEGPKRHRASGVLSGRSLAVPIERRRAQRRPTTRGAAKSLRKIRSKPGRSTSSQTPRRTAARRSTKLSVGHRSRALVKR